MVSNPVLFDNSAYKHLLKDISCANPFTGFHIDQNGNVGNCCNTWMPTFCGNLFEQSLLQIMNSSLQSDIRNSVNDGTFKYCNGKVCPNLMDYTHSKAVIEPVLEKKDLPKLDKKKLMLFLDYDLSCNLYCGSCRNERILYPLDNLPERLQKLHTSVMENLRELLDLGYELTVQVTGSGDAFASPLYWDFLKSIKSSEKFNVRLSTNGTVMTEDRFNYPYAEKIDHLSVSVDAYTEETYKKVRRGGNFKALRKNLNDLDALLNRDGLQKLKCWKINFIVQSDNYKEMADFATWALEYKSIQFVWFNLIAKWGHISDEDFFQKAVWNEKHPQHADFLGVLSHSVFDDPRVLMGNMAHYRKKLIHLSR